MKTFVRYRVCNAVLGRDESRPYKTYREAVSRRSRLKKQDKHLRGHGVLFIYKTWKEDGTHWGDALD